MKATQKGIQHFRSIAKLDETGEYVYIGRKPRDIFEDTEYITDRRYFSGYYIDDNNISWFDHRNLDGSNDAEYYMTKPEWENLFGEYEPYMTTTDTVKEPLRIYPTDRIRLKLTEIGKRAAINKVDEINKELLIEHKLERVGTPWNEDGCIEGPFNYVIQFVEYDKIVKTCEYIEFIN